MHCARLAETWLEHAEKENSERRDLGRLRGGTTGNYSTGDYSTGNYSSGNYSSGNYSSGNSFIGNSFTGNSYTSRDRSSPRHGETVAAVLRLGLRRLGHAVSLEHVAALRQGCADGIKIADAVLDETFGGTEKANSKPYPTLRDDFCAHKGTCWAFHQIPPPRFADCPPVITHVTWPERLTLSFIYRKWTSSSSPR